METSYFQLLMCRSSWFILFFLLGVKAVKKYKDGDQIEVYVNKIGPVANPHETYHYFTLPLCRPEKIVHRSLSLGQVIAGDRMAESSFNIKFNMNRTKETVCGLRNLTKEDIEALATAVEHEYYFELFLDDIKIRAPLGKVEERNVIPHIHDLYLYRTIFFEITANLDTVLQVRLLVGDLVQLKTSSEMMGLDLQYKTIWKMSNASDRSALQFNPRLTKRVTTSHWMTIGASSIAVFFVLFCILCIIGNSIRRDFLSVGSHEEDCVETGWKVIGSEVFRGPSFTAVHCAAIGVGCQFLVIFFSLLILSASGILNVHYHGSLNTIAVVLYSLTSGIAGFVSSTRYSQLDGSSWVANINVTSLLFSAPMMIIWAINNSIYWAYQSTRALPWTTVVVLLSMWLLFGYPLTVLGGILGRNCRPHYNAPCRSRIVPREIPSVSFSYHPVVFCFVGGLVPFISVMIEMPYLFNSIWGTVHTDVSSLLILAFFIMILLVSCNTIVLTYLQLTLEDYRWWWRSFFYGGSVGVFIFGYGVYFLVFHSQMQGILQLCEFFSHLLLLSYIFFLSFGAISHLASRRFVWMLYNSMKSD